MTVFKDAFFQSQWLRAVAHGSHGAAEIGECLAAALRIKEPSLDSWFVSWNELALSVLKQAELCETQGHRVSALGCYLRASNYFRAAYSILIGTKSEDRRLAQAHRQHKDAFGKAVRLMRNPTAEHVLIPYEDKKNIHGYFFHATASDSAGPCPTLIVNGGYDSTAEEAYLFSGAAAVARGYNCVVFDGPGQGTALIEDGLVFRADWENVVRYVVDFCVSRHEVDPNRVALMGVSFGGYLAPRAASGEPRLAALIADPGEYSLAEEFKTRLPKFIANQLPHGNPYVLGLLGFILNRKARHPTSGWTLRRGLWVHGVQTPLEYLQLIESYTLEGRVDKIQCPTLICQAENDHVGISAPKLFDRLENCKNKKFEFFPISQGTGEHCETGGRAVFNQRALDWLDNVMKQ